MTTKNLLTRTNHLLIFTRPGLADVELLLQDVALPALSITKAAAPAPKVAGHTIPGTGITYTPIVVSVLCDENMDAYLAIYKWLKELVEPYKGNPVKLAESYSQASLHLLTNNKTSTGLIFEFKNLWPFDLGSVEFSTKDEDDTTVSVFPVSFEYSDYVIKKDGVVI